MRKIVPISLRIKGKLLIASDSSIPYSHFGYAEFVSNTIPLSIGISLEVTLYFYNFKNCLELLKIPGTRYLKCVSELSTKNTSCPIPSHPHACAKLLHLRVPFKYERRNPVALF